MQYKNNLLNTMINVKKGSPKKIKRRAFYIISTESRGKRKIFKIGIYAGDIYSLLSRYTTYFIKSLVIHYFQYLDNAAKIETNIKEKFYDKRLNNCNGNKTEWIKIKYEKLYKYVKNIIASSKNIIVDKYANINPILDRIRNNKQKKLNDIENIKEIIKGHLVNDKELRNIVNDTDKFNKCIKSIILYYTKEVIGKKVMSEFTMNFSFIKNPKRLFRILSIIKWLEKELGISRFAFAEMKMEKPVVLMKKMLKRDRRISNG